ncbi:Uncharacterised protein [Raoultella ornithinolytica]|nr:Uncharacterised protein [Raoultella ornithinolytica]
MDRRCCLVNGCRGKCPVKNAGRTAGKHLVFPRLSGTRAVAGHAAQPLSPPSPCATVRVLRAGVAGTRGGNASGGAALRATPERECACGGAGSAAGKSLGFPAAAGPDAGERVKQRRLAGAAADSESRTGCSSFALAGIAAAGCTKTAAGNHPGE